MEILSGLDLRWETTLKKNKVNQYLRTKVGRNLLKYETCKYFD